jgi:hypothetical protein
LVLAVLPNGEPHGIYIAEITTRIVQVIEVRWHQANGIAKLEI